MKDKDMEIKYELDKGVTYDRNAAIRNDRAESGSGDGYVDDGSYRFVEWDRAGIFIDNESSRTNISFGDMVFRGYAEISSVASYFEGDT